MLAWGEHPTRVHGQPSDDDMSSHGMACAGMRRCSRIELLEKVDIDGVDGLGAHQTVCGEVWTRAWTLKNIHAAYRDTHAWSEASMVEGYTAKRCPS